MWKGNVFSIPQIPHTMHRPSTTSVTPLKLQEVPSRLYRCFRTFTKMIWTRSVHDSMNVPRSSVEILLFSLYVLVCVYIYIFLIFILEFLLTLLECARWMQATAVYEKCTLFWDLWEDGVFGAKISSHGQRLFLIAVKTGSHSWN